MDLRMTQVSAGYVFEASGRLDADAGRTLVDQVTAVAGPGVHVAIDLREVPFVNSAGLASLITCLKRAREKKSTLRLVALQPQVQEVFELTQLNHVFGMSGGEERAA